MDRDPILDSISYALRHKVGLGIKWKDDIAPRVAALRILEYMELCGYEITRRPPRNPHSTP